MMQCNTHKTYKGIKPTKKDCPACNQVYIATQNKLRQSFDPKRPYKSISTGIGFSLFYMIAEISSITLFGNQKPYFWMTNSKAAQHFQRIIKQLRAWNYKDPTTFKSVSAIFYHTCIKYRQRQVTDSIETNKKFIGVKKKKYVPELNEDDTIEIDTDAVKRSLGKKIWQKRKQREKRKQEK
jgi:hypothetical protein